MNRTILRLLFVFAFGATSACAGELIDFRDTTTSWSDVRALASNEHKLILIDAYTDWCSWCKVMDRETFTDTAVAKFINDRFVPVRYEMETGFGAIMAAKYRVNGFPTFLIFTPDGKLVYRILGYLKPKEYLDELSNALNPGKQEHLTGISPDLEPGFPRFYLQSFLKKGVRKRPDTSVVLAFLGERADLSSEIAWSVMFRFSYLLTQPYKDYFFKNYDRLKSLYGANDVGSVASTFLAADLNAAIKANDPGKLEEVIASSARYLNEPEGDLRLAYTLRFDQETERWKAYAGLIDSTRKSANPPDPNVINNYSWAIYEHCPDKEIVSRAIVWMSEAVVQSPSYMLLDTYAALLFKSGDLKKAKEYAETAIEAGKKEKQDFQETQELLKNINAAIEKKL